MNPTLCLKCCEMLSCPIPRPQLEGSKRCPASTLFQKYTMEEMQRSAVESCNLCLRLYHILGPKLQHKEFQLIMSSIAKQTSFEEEIRDHSDVTAAFSFSLCVIRIGHVKPSHEIRLFFDHDRYWSNVIMDLRSRGCTEWSTQALCNSEDGSNRKEYLDVEELSNTKHVDGSTSSESTWELVHRWMQDCTQNHKECNSQLSASPRTIPRRIIDIGYEGTTTLRLIDIEVQQITLLTYATMSHCWGNHMPFMLTQRNINDLLTSFSMDKLSKSFRDGVMIAQRLGLSYLWIDSLCILQDSAEDWAQQSAQMADIYSGSYCNIAAAHAVDGTHGCFTTRDPRLLIPIRLQLSGEAQPYYPITADFWESNVLETPLNRRAWVVQERIFAPRTLFYGKHQVFWQCLERRACEEYPIRLPQYCTPLINLQSEWKHKNSITPLQAWARIIEEYSARELTYPEDKLAALSGLAARMHKHMNSQYMAGLWRHDLPRQLLWDREALANTRKNLSIAPSWSWASMGGAIVLSVSESRPEDFLYLIHISGVNTILRTPSNPYGQVTGGSLQLVGRLFQKEGLFEIADTFAGLYVNLQSCDDKMEVGQGVLDYVDENRSQHDMYFLPVKAVKDAKKYKRARGIRYIKGLIIQPVSQETTKHFLRVGTFTMGRDSFYELLRRVYGINVEDKDLESSWWNSAADLDEITII